MGHCQHTDNLPHLPLESKGLSTLWAPSAKAPFLKECKEGLFQKAFTGSLLPIGRKKPKTSELSFHQIVTNCSQLLAVGEYPRWGWKKGSCTSGCPLFPSTTQRARHPLAAVKGSQATHCTTHRSVPKKNKTEYIYFTFVILKMKGYETPLACY